VLTKEAYANFIKQSVAWHQAQELQMTCWADPASPSPCQQQWVAADQVSWLPVIQENPADFLNVEHALEMPLHTDIKVFYGSFYGANLAAEHPRGKLALLMPWNSDDMARLQENIIGHILMKRRLKQRETVFFAVTDDENIMLSILNNTGEIFLESVGKEVAQKVANNLADFLAELTPLAYSPLFD